MAGSGAISFAGLAPVIVTGTTARAPKPTTTKTA